MRRIMDKGDSYAKEELSRLSGIVSTGGLDSKKLDGFMIRMNILKVFTGEADNIGASTTKGDEINPDDIFEFAHEGL